MKYIIRNFIHVLKRFKTSSILNLLGLSAALTVFTVTMIQVKYDFSFNKGFTNSEQIYVHNMYRHADGKNAYHINNYIGRDIKKRFPEVVEFCAIRSDHDGAFDAVRDDGEKYLAYADISEVSDGFTTVFTPEIIAGDPNEALKETGKAILSESTAKTFFGNEDPLGKMFFIHGTDRQYTVSAVIKDFPEHCNLINGIFLQLADGREGHQHSAGYFLINGDAKKVVDKMNSAEFLGEKSIQLFEENPDKRVEFDMIPLHDSHFNLPGVGEGNLATTLSLLAIGIVTLIIALINYLNFTVAVAPVRAKAINIQRILGADRFGIRVTIIFETILFLLLAFILALIFLVLLRGSAVEEIFSADLKIEGNLKIIIYIALFLCFIGFVFGSYVAKYLTNFKNNAGKSAPIRNILITIQYTAAVCMVIVASFIAIQNNHMQNYSWGIEKDNVIYLQIRDKTRNYIEAEAKVVGGEMMKNPNVLGYTSSQYQPGRIYSGWGRMFQEKQTQMTPWGVRDNFLDFFGVKIIEGKNFTDYSPEKRMVLFNQTFMKKYDFEPKDIFGKEMHCIDDAGEVIGIVEDINFESLKTNIGPMAFFTVAELYHDWLFIRVSDKDLKKTIEHIEGVWNKFSDTPFALNFLDDNMNTLYKQEINLGKTVITFGLIAILIAMMGVYGLITFNSRNRAKEIAIRKVNGAEELSIVYMLNRNALFQFAVACLIAIPLAYYITQKWLEGFAYKTPIYWWVFFLSALVVLIISVATISWQSYKAAVVNPVDSLKSE